MVKGRRAPAICSVALTAIEAKATLVRLIIMMTGIAVLGRDRKITQTPGVDMALYTCKAHVLTG